RGRIRRLPLHPWVVPAGIESAVGFKAGVSDRRERFRVASEGSARPNQLRAQIARVKRRDWACVVVVSDTLVGTGKQLQIVRLTRMRGRIHIREGTTTRIQ